MIHLHPCPSSRVLVAVQGCFSFPDAGGDMEGTWGCGSGCYVWENEIITARTARGERGENITTASCCAISGLILSRQIGIYKHRACALCCERVRQTVDCRVISTLMNQQHPKTQITNPHALRAVNTWPKRCLRPLSILTENVSLFTVRIWLSHFVCPVGKVWH